MVEPWPYSADFYRLHTVAPLVTEARRLGNALWRYFAPKSVVDVGCGPGAVLWGIDGREVLLVGLEHPAVLDMFRQSPDLWLPYAMLFPIDLEDPRSFPYAGTAPFDLAISLETAEHVSPKAGDDLVRLLTELSDTVVWSAAIPGQGGDHHIHEQPLEFWERQFKELGFDIDPVSTFDLQHSVGPFIAAWWYERVRVFRSR